MGKLGHLIPAIQNLQRMLYTVWNDSDHKLAVIQGIWQLQILQPSGLLIEPTKISTI